MLKMLTAVPEVAIPAGIFTPSMKHEISSLPTAFCQLKHLNTYAPKHSFLNIVTYKLHNLSTFSTF